MVLDCMLFTFPLMHPSLPLMNSFNKTDAAFFLVQAMLLEGFPFHRFKNEPINPGLTLYSSLETQHKRSNALSIRAEIQLNVHVGGHVIQWFHR